MEVKNDAKTFRTEILYQILDGKIKTTRIAGGLLQPYKGLLPASV